MRHEEDTGRRSRSFREFGSKTAKNSSNISQSALIFSENVKWELTVRLPGRRPAPVLLRRGVLSAHLLSVYPNIKDRVCNRMQRQMGSPSVKRVQYPFNPQ
eukprot:1557741-Rhodomonas_salina.1